MFRTIPLAQTSAVLACSALFCSCRAPEWYSKDSKSPELPADVAFNTEAGHGDYLFITVRSENGENWLFGVDTGGPVTVLDKSLEGRLGKHLSAKQIQTGWMGKIPVGVFASPKLYLGKTPLVMGDEVWTTDLSRFSYRHRMMGVLGMDCLRHYCLQLDFAADKMTFLDPDAVEANSGKAFPLKFSRAGITIQTAFINDAEVDSGIDSAEYLDGSLESDQFQRALNKYPETMVTQWTNSDGTVFRKAQFSSCNFGGETYTNVVVREHANGGNTIGLHLLSRHLVTLNFPKRTMYLQDRP
jgi:hypothetical protein